MALEQACAACAEKDAQLEHCTEACGEWELVARAATMRADRAKARCAALRAALSKRSETTGSDTPVRYVTWEEMLASNVARKTRSGPA